ncbi:MAG: Gfo/Idh/MocA family oxidoreductase [Clostridia bacterium]|nr:Gfo/Idh/MocA family oxidoreductase [Clostridia bacterium]
MRKVKIAQIGTSRYSHGNVIFGSLKKNSDVFEIAGYVMPENEREKWPGNMEAFKAHKELTIEEVLNDPEIEAVTIETEEKYLTKYALLAAKAGKHIHMEKPGGCDVAEFCKMIEAVKEGKKVFHTGYMYRYNPYIMRLMERIKAGELGEIISVEAQMSGYHPKVQREWLSEYNGGILFFLGCHLIDLIYGIMGKPDEIIPLSRKTGTDGLTTTDFGMAAFTYKKGVSFAKTTDVEMGGFARRQLVVTGTKGTVEIRPLENHKEYPTTTSSYREVFDTAWLSDVEFVTTEKFDRYDAMMKSFAQMVRGEKENPWSYDYELELYKIIMEACK